MDILPEEKLYRWLHPSQFKWDENRPTSAAFTDPYMSVDISSLTTLTESYDRAKKNRKTAVVSILAEIAYEKEQEICHCPTHVLREDQSVQICTVKDECKSFNHDIMPNSLELINPAHACVIGNKTNSTRKFFVNNSIVEIYPPTQSD